MYPVFPIFFLIIALGAIFFYQRASHELTRVLMAVTATVCLIWGFAIAHWSIHLLCLALLLRFRSPSKIMQMVKIQK